MLAFAYTQEPVELTLAAERRKPQVTVRQLLVARVEEGVVKYDFTFFYNVLYSGVKSLRIDVPAEVADGLRVATPGVHEKTIDPPPADLAKDGRRLEPDRRVGADGRRQDRAATGRRRSRSSTSARPSSSPCRI